MAFDNTVVLVGNVTRDPEIRQTSVGNTMTTMGLAWNNRYRKGEDWVEEPNFFDVTCFGQLAENVSESITRGMRVVVYGRLSFRRWETDNGEPRQKVEVIADEVSPSLRWATARVEKNPYAGGGQGGGGQYGGGGGGQGGGGYGGGGGGQYGGGGGGYAGDDGYQDSPPGGGGGGGASPAGGQDPEEPF